MVIDSVGIFSANNGVFALDAVTGTQIWHVPDARDPGSPPGCTGCVRRHRRGRRRPRPGDVGTGLRLTYWPGPMVPAAMTSTIRQCGHACHRCQDRQAHHELRENGVLPGITPDSPPVIYRNVLVTDGDFEPAKGKTVKGGTSRANRLDLVCEGAAGRSES
jgi:hypothetical protein